VVQRLINTFKRGMVMDDQDRCGRARRLRWRLRSLMIAIAVVTVALALARPFATPASIRAARAVLEEYGPAADPAFRSGDYRADSVVKTLPGYLQVRFVRVAGNGPPERVVTVSAKAVSQARLNPWWTPRTEPTQSASR
jgi:hypothetical protein